MTANICGLPYYVLVTFTFISFSPNKNSTIGTFYFFFFNPLLKMYNLEFRKVKYFAQGFSANQ